MKYILYIIILMVMVGCEATLPPSPTATLAAPTATIPATTIPAPDPTPTQEVISDLPLNNNYDLSVTCPPTPIIRVNGRDVCVPFNWFVSWYPNLLITDPNPHPEVLPIDGGGIRFEVTSRGGAFGLASHIATQAGKRYIVVGEYFADLHVMQGAALNSRHYYGYCKLDNLASFSTITHKQPGVLQGEGEFICVLETSESRTVRFDALLNIDWQVLEGHIDFYEIRAIQVSADDYGDAVIVLP
jgi:hypothetical protein